MGPLNHGMLQMVYPHIITLNVVVKNIKKS